MEGSISLLGVCLGGHLFHSSDRGINLLVNHLLQDLFYSFSTFNGDLSSCLLNWRDGRIKADGVCSRHIACTIKGLTECFFKGDDVLHILYGCMVLMKGHLLHLLLQIGVLERA